MTNDDKRYLNKYLDGRNKPSFLTNLSFLDVLTTLDTFVPSAVFLHITTAPFMTFTANNNS